MGNHSPSPLANNQISDQLTQRTRVNKCHFPHKYDQDKYGNGSSHRTYSPEFCWSNPNSLSLRERLDHPLIEIRHVTHDQAGGFKNVRSLYTVMELSLIKENTDCCTSEKIVTVPTSRYIGYEIKQNLVPK